MLRSLAIALVLVFPALAQARPGTIIQSESHGGPAAPLTERLWNTMDLESLMPILRDEAVAEAVTAAGGNMAEAARRLGIARSTLYRKLSDLGIDNAA